MSATNILEEKCKKASITYERKGNSIIALPKAPQGFPVRYDYSSRHVVSYLGWHEEFDNQDEALNCFAFGLSNVCRLKVLKKGSFSYKWTVEAQDEHGNWYEDSTTGLFIFPFWMKTTTLILQNHLISE